MRRRYRNEKQRKRDARRSRIGKMTANPQRARVTVFRSSKHIYAQLVDVDGRTLGAVSTRTPRIREGLAATGNVEAARRVGQALAELAQERQIEEVVFNRNGFLYHGRVRALADAAREAGLRF